MNNDINILKHCISIRMFRIRITLQKDIQNYGVTEYYLFIKQE